VYIANYLPFAFVRREIEVPTIMSSVTKHPETTTRGCEEWRNEKNHWDPEGGKN
jgi:hypothetical protein